MISEHKADAKYLVVAAASIIAKVERDKEISELCKNYGDLGSGYITDFKTVKFLKEWIKKFGSYPDFVRKSWKPAKKIRLDAEFEQKRLDA